MWQPVFDSSAPAAADAFKRCSPEDVTGPSRTMPRTTGAEADVAAATKLDVKEPKCGVASIIAASAVASAIDMIESTLPPADAEAERVGKEDVCYDKDVRATILR